MTDSIQQARTGQKYFKTIYGNWVKVLWVGLGSIRFAYLDIKGMALLQNNLYRAANKHYADKMEQIMITANLRKKNELVESTVIDQDNFSILIA